MSITIQPDPPILPPADLPDNLPDDPFQPPSPKNPIPPLPDLYPTDPPPLMPYPETPRLPGNPPLIGETVRLMGW